MQMTPHVMIQKVEKGSTRRRSSAITLCTAHPASGAQGSAMGFSRSERVTG